MKVRFVFIDGEDLEIVVEQRTLKAFSDSMERKNRVIVNNHILILRNIAYIEKV